MFNGKLEALKKRKNGSVSRIQSLIDELETARVEAQDVIEGCDDTIDELEDMRDDAVKVRQFAENVTQQWD